MLVDGDVGLNTAEFDNKIFTKEWLDENTTFAYPKNIIALDDFDKASGRFLGLPRGSYVWKPCYGRKSWGVALVEKNIDGFKVYPSDEIMSSEDVVRELTRIKKLSISEVREAGRFKKWFIEEWIYPHERFHKFTDDKRLPPIIRVCGRKKVHFVTLSPVYLNLSGIAPTGWKQRKYIWLDFDGVIIREEDLNLKRASILTRRIVPERSVETPFYGEKIEGIRELVKQVNREISPKLAFKANRSWSVDGIFDKNNKFIVIEINKMAAPGFTGVTWKGKSRRL
jgi:hypothetical protein